MFSRPVFRLGFFVLCISILAAIISAVVGEKTTFLYKDTLHLTASQITTLNLILNVPFYIQPFLAGWTETRTWHGYRRRPYYLLGIGVSALAYVALSQLRHYAYLPVVLLVLTATLGLAIRVLVFNAFFASVGNRTGSTGMIQNILSLAIPLLQMAFTGHFGGYVAEHWSYSQAYLVAAGLLLLYVPFLFLIEDPRVAHLEQQKQDAQATRLLLREALKDRRLLIAVAFIAYIALTPAPMTAMVYYQTDVLHFSKQFIGDLNGYLAAGQVVGFFASLALCRWLSLRWVAVLYCLSNLLLYSGYLLMGNAFTAKLSFLLQGFSGIIASICFVIFYVRTCPRGIEGTISSVFFAVAAFFYLLCDKWGTGLYDYYGPANHGTIQHGWYMSNFIGIGMAFGAFFFLPFLPLWTKSHDKISAPNNNL